MKKQIGLCNFTLEASKKLSNYLTEVLKQYNSVCWSFANMKFLGFFALF